MKVSVYNMAGEEVDQIDLPSAIFEAPVNRDLMHQALVRQLANARLGTHKVKGRSEVNRTTAKMYRQKGTGNARHGSRRAPIFVGGGVAHGPSPRKYTKKMPRKMRRAALRSALTVKAGSGNVVIVDQFTADAAKTKPMVEAMRLLVNDSSVLLLLPEANDNVEKSLRNVANVKALLAGYLNIRDLLGYDKVIMPVATLAALDGFLTPDNEWEVVEEEE